MMIGSIGLMLLIYGIISESCHLWSILSPQLCSAQTGTPIRSGNLVYYINSGTARLDTFLYIIYLSTLSDIYAMGYMCGVLPSIRPRSNSIFKIVCSETLILVFVHYGSSLDVMEVQSSVVMKYCSILSSSFYISRIQSCTWSNNNDPLAWDFAGLEITIFRGASFGRFGSRTDRTPLSIVALMDCSSTSSGRGKERLNDRFLRLIVSDFPFSPSDCISAFLSAAIESNPLWISSFTSSSPSPGRSADMS